MSIARDPGNDGAPPGAFAEPSDSCRHVHTVQFYGEETSLIDQLSRVVSVALGVGDSVVVIATERHAINLAQVLAARGIELTRAIEQGRYISLDADETLAKVMRDGLPDAELFNEVVGGIMERAASAQEKTPRILVFGEMVALLWAQGNSEGTVRLEQLWNNLLRTRSLSLLCAYPISSFNREDHDKLFLKICTEHDNVIPEESYTALLTEEQRLRSIVHLQQKAQALETEVAERKRVEAVLRGAKAELELLVEQHAGALRQVCFQVLSLQDTERRRIARELHDVLGQSLVGLKFNIDLLRLYPAREDLWLDSETLMEQCISEVRSLSYLLHPPTLDVAGFASAATWYVEGFGQRSGIAVTLDAANDLGRLPDATELALFRALQEALTNVQRHSGANAAAIRVWADGEHVYLEVRDSGRGIPPDVLRQFGTTGTGMGPNLTAIRQRILELGGKLNLESGGQGTLLSVTVPRGTVESLSPKGPQPIPEAGQRKNSPMPLRILVADDHPVVIRKLQNLLSEHPGWEVVGTASDGVEAVEKAIAMKPDIVVLDIGMPEMDGLEACRLIRNKLPACEVLIVTQHDSNAMFRESQIAGARGWVVKSNIIKDLLAAVQTVSQHRYFPAPTFALITDSK
jgi:signal transduction histidine kinase/ActR/RegA family two-component response regulator